MWKREPLSDDQLEALIQAAEDTDGIEAEFTVRVLAYSGLRASEFAQLESDWMDWQGERLRVPKTAKLKSRHAVRTIPIKNPDTLRVMRTFFKMYDGVDVSRQAVYQRVVKVAKRTDIRKKVTPHVLRHTYGTMIARKGASPQYIRQTMGHADLSSANNYLQYTGTQLDAEAEELF